MSLPPLKEMRETIMKWAATADPENIIFIWTLISGKWAR